MRFISQLKSAQSGWHVPLVVEQGEQVARPAEEILEAFDSALAFGQTPAAILSPLPIRGYGMIFEVEERTAYGSLHVLGNQPDEAYRSLFSALIREAQRQGASVIVFDPHITDPKVQEKIVKFGQDYGIFLAEHWYFAEEEPEEVAEEPEEEVEESFECSECGRAFKTSQALGAHSRVHA